MGTTEIDCTEEQLQELNFNTVRVDSVTDESLSIIVSKLV